MARSKRLRRYRGWLAAVVLVAIGVTAYLVTRDSGAGTTTTTYTTEQAAIGTISVTVSGTGNLEIDGTTDVYPAVSGEVATLKVSEGSSVTTGTVLFTLDAASAEANAAKALAGYRQSQQQVAQASAQVAKAQSSLADLKARSKEPTNTVSAADIAAAQAEVTSAKAGLASAKASSAMALIEYEDAREAEDDLAVASPCSGVVYALNIEAGDSVSTAGGAAQSSSASTGMTQTSTTSSSSSGAPVIIAPEQPLAVHLTVNEVDLPSLKTGQRAEITFDAYPDLTATGKVYEIADEGSNSSGVVTFDVWVSLDVADPGLRSGMSAAATIVTDVAKDTLLVSNAAVKSDGEGGYYVRVLDEGSETPRQIVVETGLASATQTQILAGISAGDTVVTQTVDDSASDTQTQPGGGMMVPGMGGGPRG
jgi:multidrug efflux pump subunit AcrA (membrane-fusion protein)